ncbi:MAG TPA: TIGR03618 family F420-dependent PPOX class oxidoreductase [Acidimicrobiales bacterium]
MSRRDIIRMTDDEVSEFIGGRRTMNVATIGPDGNVHLIAMWYGFLDGKPAFETYAKSQKVLNIERDPRVTVLIEAGDQYDQLRGVELVGTAEIVRDDERKTKIAASVVERYWDFGDDPAAIELAVANLVNKRVGIVITADKVVSWDHRKLGGTY